MTCDLHLRRPDAKHERTSRILVLDYDHVAARKNTRLNLRTREQNNAFT